MAATKEDRDKQASVGVQVTEHRVTIAEGRIANLEEDEPTTVSPQMPGRSPMIEGEGQVPMAWQIRVVQVSAQGDKPVGAKFEIYSPEAYNNGKKLTSMDWGTGGWITLHEEQITQDMNVVARFTYKVEGEGEEKTRTLTWYATVVEAFNKTPETPADGVEVEDVLIATLHASGWQRITQYHTGAIFLGGGSGGGGAAVNPEDFNIYITKIGEEFWLTQGQEKKTTATGVTYTPKRRIMRLDNVLLGLCVAHVDNPSAGSSAKQPVLVTKPYDWSNIAFMVEGMGYDAVSINNANFADTIVHQTLRGYETTWMNAFCVSYPDDDTDQGSVMGASSTGMFFSTEEPSRSADDVYFYTELMDTNIAGSTYAST